MENLSLSRILALWLLVPSAFCVDAKSAVASEWGCEVLLCASSSNPSWHGIPSCQPPMRKLIAAMRGWNFSWPTCPEAGTGAPGFEKYQHCNAGYTAVTGDNGGHGFSRAEANICQKTENPCEGRPWMRHDDGGCSRIVDSYARPLRAQPYYFDIGLSTGSGTSRHYFDLND